MSEGLGRYGKDGPTLDGSVIVGFILVVIASCGAFVWVDDVQGRNMGSPVRVYQAEGESGQEAPAAFDRRPAAGELDTLTTASVARSEAGADGHPQCDMSACADAYRSFRVSDCTFQPYEGPRRLCTR